MAIREAYKDLDEPDFSALTEEMERRGATGVDISILKKIVDFNLFANERDSVRPEDWLNTSIVVDFKQFGTDSDTKALAVALILNFLIKKLGQQLAVKNDIQPIRMVLFVDEAHLLLPKESKAGLLSTLARQGRSWGFPVWLASQDADKFLTSGANEPTRRVGRVRHSLFSTYTDGRAATNDPWRRYSYETQEDRGGLEGCRRNS